MNLKIRTIESALEVLLNLGCAYAVKTADKQIYEHGTLFVEQPARQKRGTKYGYGAIKRYYLPFIENMAPGDYVEVPTGSFDIIDLQAGLSACCVKIWGTGSTTTSINREKQAVEVLRVR